MIFHFIFRMLAKPHTEIYCRNPNNLSYDEACLNIYAHNLTHPVKLYYQYEECHKVSYISGVCLR